MSSVRATPASAVFTAGPPDDLVTIGFSEELFTDAVVDPTNWTVRWNNLTYTVTAAQVLLFDVILTVVAGGADVGADVVSFSPPPSDVVTNLSGLGVLAFADYPLV